MLIRLGGLFFIVATIFWLWSIFDLVFSPTDRVRNLPKLLWSVIVILGLEVGAVAWVLFGRPRNQPLAPTRDSIPPLFGDWPSGRGRAAGREQRPKGPVGPDDDPDFLRKL